MNDLLCFSHLRWDFVFQRPQHLLTRAARTYRVTFWEEPDWMERGEPHLAISNPCPGVTVVQPRLPWGADHDSALRVLLDAHLAQRAIHRPLLWYYTPQALTFGGHVPGACTVYDCMDELSAFRGANPHLPELEQALLSRADLVFTGGRSLFEAKCRLHPAVHAFPSGVDVDHFRAARAPMPDPAAQLPIPRPRAGFYGVIDERLDTALLAGVAARCPEIQFVVLGPTSKIDAASLPSAPNLHYPGPAAYADLPAWIAGWEVALMPFALNEATRFISPTKTPEYLAAGRPVVSTPVPDVVHGWASQPGVSVAQGADAFAAAVRRALVLPPETWRLAADAVLDGLSWDGIWSRMDALIRQHGSRDSRIAAE